MTESLVPLGSGAMFDRIAPTYDTLNHLLSAGVDNFWRTVVAREVPDPSARVLDLCAGTLDLGVAVQKEHPDAQVICADFAVEMLRRGAHKLPHAGLAGADAMVSDVKALLGSASG